MYSKNKYKIQTCVSVGSEISGIISMIDSNWVIAFQNLKRL